MMRHSPWQKSLKYISGPLTIGDRHENVSRAIMVGEFYYRQGFPIHIPHLNVRWEDYYGTPYEDILHIDSEVIRRMFTWDEIIRIPGASPGADREVEFGLKQGISSKIMTVADCEEVEESLGESFPYLAPGQAKLKGLTPAS